MVVLRSADGRLRSGWRILSFVLLLLPLAVAGQLGARGVLGGLPRGSTLALAIVAAAATIAVFIARRWFDRLGFVSLGLAVDIWTVKDLLFGMMLSGLMAGLAFGAMAGSGLIQDIQASPISISTLLFLLLPAILTGW